MPVKLYFTTGISNWLCVNSDSVDTQQPITRARGVWGSVNMKLEPQKISSIKCVVSLRPRTTILYTISLGFMFRAQTLTSCQMLPVTVTGSAFDRKIVSVLPVPFCQVLVSLWFLFARAHMNKPPRTPTNACS